jgi:hypothetical protein
LPRAPLAAGAHRHSPRAIGSAAAARCAKPSAESPVPPAPTPPSTPPSAAQDGPRIFIVLEYCAGGDLGRYIRRYGRVSEATARYFLLQLAEGLKELRRHNVIHVRARARGKLKKRRGKGPARPRRCVVVPPGLSFARAHRSRVGRAAGSPSAGGTPRLGGCMA